MSLPPFPPSFVFGCGNSDSQCEAYEPAFADIRDLWYERRRMQARGKATDFWNRFGEDVELARKLGCKMFRFSVAWSRVEPAFGQWNQAALDHYSEMVDVILAAGMQPMVTLHHFTWPVHIEERGGLLADDFPSTFATYAKKVGERMGSRVTYWITFNEPNILQFGYVKPWWERNYFAPPGLPADAAGGAQGVALAKLMKNLFLAHRAARNVIKAINPAAKLGANPANLGLPVWLQRFMDRNVVNLRTPDDLASQARGLAERRFLEEGKLDVIVAMFTKTDERAAALDFAEVYFIGSHRVMVLAGSPVANADGLARQKVAAVKTSTAETTVAERMPQSVLVSAEHFSDCQKLLDSGGAAAIVGDDARLNAAMRATPGRYRLLPDVLTSEPYAPAVSKGNARLLEEVNAAVRDFIESGAWADSYRRHLGEPVPEPPKLPSLANLGDVADAAAPLQKEARERGADRPADLLDRIRARNRIRIGVKDVVAGFGAPGPDGKLAGLEIDIAHAIGKRIVPAGTVELLPVATKERIPFLRTLVRFLDPLLKAWGLLATSATTSWWHLGMAGKLRPFLCPPECVGQLDFVGFDYYWGISSLRITKIMNLIDALGAGRLENAPVHPPGLYFWIKELGSLFPTLPIIVVENGCVETADGVDRTTYLEQHIRQVQRAVADGAKVEAYLGWSVTSNRELGHRFRPGTDFGLYHVELDNDPALTRTVTPSAERYREIIAARTVD